MLVIEQKPISFILHQNPILQPLKESSGKLRKSVTKRLN